MKYALANCSGMSGINEHMACVYRKVINHGVMQPADCYYSIIFCFHHQSPRVVQCILRNCLKLYPLKVRYYSAFNQDCIGLRALQNLSVNFPAKPTPILHSVVHIFHSFSKNSVLVSVALKPKKQSLSKPLAEVHFPSQSGTRSISQPFFHF